MKKRINVEGDEAFKTPNGQIGEFKGASHANGGIDVSVPQGTFIFSKELVDNNGMSMAERAMRRAKLEKKISKHLIGKPSKLAEGSAKRMLDNLNLEEQSDLEFQGNVAMLGADKVKKALGTGKQGVQSYAPGSGPNGVTTTANNSVYNGVDSLSPNATEDELRAHVKAMKAIQGAGGFVNGKPDPLFKQKQIELQAYFDADPQRQTDYAEVYNMLQAHNNTTSSSTKQLQKEDGFYGQDMYAVYDMFDKKLTPSATPAATPATTPALETEVPELSDPTVKEEVDSGNGQTKYDAMGNAVSAIGQTLPFGTTLANRLTTPKNTNFFKGYGRDALESNSRGMDLLDLSKTDALGDITLSENNAMRRNRNSARSVNTIRALDIASENASNDAKGKVYTNYNTILTDAFNKRAGLQNERDSKVMQGEHDRDLADRQDSDAFYSNMSTDIKSATELGMNRAKMGNENILNNYIAELIGTTSKYGVTTEDAGAKSPLQPTKRQARRNKRHG